ncbi:hypothetical protein PAWBP_5810 [Paulownia witches'-broom phytoplasma]|nr:hypothetical protein PAWBP_5810 [Paulownia witches'-broom phytoplasma]
MVVDSVAALVPEAELVGDMGNMAMGLQARMMGQAMRKQSGITNKTDTVVIYINQLREKTEMGFGNLEVTPGGKALKFFASLRLDIRRAETLKQRDQVVGIRSKVKVVKSKLSSPLKTTTIDIIFGKGIAKMIEVIDLATNLNLIQKSGSWYSFKDEKIGQGKESVKKYLTNNPKIYNHLVAEIKKKI